ncbi:hypothetical protein ACOMHN_054775 [Nucella lapillus]
MAELDLINCDPNSINTRLKVSFEDVLAEPEGVHSMDCVWNLCYKIYTLFCGICIAMEWGCEFAGIAFTHVWYVTPCFKVLELNCGCLQKLYGMCVHCCMDPCCEACGILFSAFKKG